MGFSGNLDLTEKHNRLKCCVSVNVEQNLDRKERKKQNQNSPGKKNIALVRDKSSIPVNFTGK